MAAGSDPEAEFLATLSSREKHLLLLHLEVLSAVCVSADVAKSKQH